VAFTRRRAQCECCFIKGILLLVFTFSQHFLGGPVFSVAYCRW